MESKDMDQVGENFPKEISEENQLFNESLISPAALKVHIAFIYIF